MTIEATLERIAVALETIAKQGGTVAQATAELGKPETPAAPAPAPKAGKGKANEKVTEAAGAAANAANSPAPAPAAATAQSPSDAAPAWADVLVKIKELNTSDKPGHGREGVVNVLTKFGLDPRPVDQGGKGDTVPKLQALNKNADVLAFVESLLNAAAAPAPAADADIFG